MLNVALFGMTAKQWQDQNPDKKGNIRDYAKVPQLICLSNLENLNAYLMERGISQSERLLELNKAAIRQMKILVEERAKYLIRAQMSRGTSLTSYLLEFVLSILPVWQQA